MVQNKRLYFILTAVVGLLLLPLIAMQFTNDVKWTAFDFTAAAALLLSTGLTIEFVLRKVKSTQNRLILGAIILFLLFFIWLELAVGVFGTPLAGS